VSFGKTTYRDFEYKALISNFYCVINTVNTRYDEYYISPTKLLELTAILQKDDLYLVHFKRDDNHNENILRYLLGKLSAI